MGRAPGVSSGNPIDAALALLEDAERILVLTGAGVSAESGVPTFRGPDGLWKTYRPEQLATPGAFAADPRLVWEWYGWRRERVSTCRPNPAHRALASLTLRSPGAHVVTQNVDGLHGLALEEETDGRAPADHDALPLELHGSLFRVRCTVCSHRAVHRDAIDAGSPATLPHCPDCGALLRPDIVWFGESLDPEVLDAAFGLAEMAEICLVVGTSAVVHPAASIPLVTLRAGGLVLEVNPEPTPLTQAARVSLRGPAGELLPRLFANQRG